LSPQNYVDLHRASSAAASAANRATAAAENQRVKNEFENQKIAITRAGLELRESKADDPRPPIIKYLDQEYADKNLDPEEYAYLKKRYRQYATNPSQDVQEFLAEARELIRGKTPGTPTPETKTDTPPPKSRVLAPKGFVYMVDAKGQAGLVREENVEKAMTRGGRIL
jgi:hypothetical protein